VHRGGYDSSDDDYEEKDGGQESMPPESGRDGHEDVGHLAGGDGAEEPPGDAGGDMWFDDDLKTSYGFDDNCRHEPDGEEDAPDDGGDGYDSPPDDADYDDQADNGYNDYVDIYDDDDWSGVLSRSQRVSGSGHDPSR
jgi:hypothetical protein